MLASANMSTGAGPASQSGKKRKEFWEYSQEEVEEHEEEQVPRITQGEDEYEEEIESESDSSDDDMEEEEGTEGERNTDGSHSRKQNRKPTKVGTIRQEFTAVTTAGVPSEPNVLRKDTVVKSRRSSGTPSRSPQ